MIQIGALLEHTPTKRVYRILAIGKMRLPSGEWVEAARYELVMYSRSEVMNADFALSAAVSDGKVEYYRPLNNFDNFTTYAP